MTFFCHAFFVGETDGSGFGIGWFEGMSRSLVFGRLHTFTGGKGKMNELTEKG